MTVIALLFAASCGGADDTGSSDRDPPADASTSSSTSTSTTAAATTTVAPPSTGEPGPEGDTGGPLFAELPDLPAVELASAVDHADLVGSLVTEGDLPPSLGRAPVWRESGVWVEPELAERSEEQLVNPCGEAIVSNPTVPAALRVAMTPEDDATEVFTSVAFDADLDLTAALDAAMEACDGDWQDDAVFGFLPGIASLRASGDAEQLVDGDLGDGDVVDATLWHFEIRPDPGRDHITADAYLGAADAAERSQLVMIVLRRGTLFAREAGGVRPIPDVMTDVVAETSRRLASPGAPLFAHGVDVVPIGELTDPAGAVMGERPFVPQDPTRFRAYAFVEGPRPDGGPGPERSAIEAELTRMANSIADGDAILAAYEELRDAEVLPHPTLEAATALLVGTRAESLVDFVLTGGQEHHVGLEGQSANVANPTAIAFGNEVRWSEDLLADHFAFVAPIVAHEVLHSGAAVVTEDEEVFNNVFDAFLFAELFVRHPELADLETAYAPRARAVALWIANTVGEGGSGVRAESGRPILGGWSAPSIEAAVRDAYNDTTPRGRDSDLFASVMASLGTDIGDVQIGTPEAVDLLAEALGAVEVDFVVRLADAVGLGVPAG
ncbi:MAG: hypothetical protein R8F63_03805 [Acidimicrobiales bacterium]|nr:hypothetical protein [Acidimicrobiales bacterium]